MIVCEKTFTGRKLAINDNVMRFFSDIISSHVFCKETGGIIVGEIKSIDDVIVITDVSSPYKNDKRGRCHFNRKSDGHQEFMDKLWEESGLKKMYFGEWHTHNQTEPIPSFIDISNWKKIERRNTVAPEMFFIIVGTRRIKIWNVLNGTISKIDIGDVMYEK